MFCVLTSFTPNPARKARQAHCEAVWRAFGVRVVALQGVGERIELGPDSAVEWHETLDPGPVKLAALWDFASTFGGRLLLVNSDLEPTEKIAELLERDCADELVAVRRWNHPAGNPSAAIPEQWGIDGFWLTARDPNPFEGLPFAMGRPWWDWFLPLWYLRNNRSVTEIRCSRPMLLHESHDLDWNWSKWRELGEFVIPEQLKPRARTERFWDDLRRQVTRELRLGMARVRIAA